MRHARRESRILTQAVVAVAVAAICTSVVSGCSSPPDGQAAAEKETSSKSAKADITQILDSLVVGRDSPNTVVGSDN
jgi:hypothetical protein